MVRDDGCALINFNELHSQYIIIFMQLTQKHTPVYKSTQTTFISSFVHYYFCVYFTFSFIFVVYNFYKHSYCCYSVCCCFSALFTRRLRHTNTFNSLNSHIFFIFMWESLLSSSLLYVVMYKGTKIPAIYKVIHKFYPIIIFVNQELRNRITTTTKKKWYRKDLIVHHYECV